MYRNPIIKLPIAFTKKVAKGRLVSKSFTMFKLIKNLDTAPIPPPKNIAKRLSMNF